MKIRHNGMNTYLVTGENGTTFNVVIKPDERSNTTIKVIGLDIINDLETPIGVSPEGTYVIDSFSGRHDFKDHKSFRSALVFVLQIMCDRVVARTENQRKATRATKARDKHLDWLQSLNNKDEEIYV